MITFGKFILSEREKKSITQIEMTKLCRFVSNGSISRVESSKTSPSLITVVKMCFALGITAETIYTIFSNRKDSPKYFKDTLDEFLASVKMNKLLNMSSDLFLQDRDLGIINTSLEKNYSKTIFLITKTINKTILAYLEKSKNNNNGDKDIVFQEITAQSFSNFISPNPIVPFTISYPSLTPDFIFEVFRNNGIILPLDVGNVIKNLRNNKSITLRELAVTSKLAPLTLSKIEEGIIPRITLDDCLSLDSSLFANGIIFALLWRAVCYINCFGDINDPFFEPDEVEKHIIKRIDQLIVNLSRWWCMPEISNISWLSEFRLNVNEIIL